MKATSSVILLTAANPDLEMVQGIHNLEQGIHKLEQGIRKLEQGIRRLEDFVDSCSVHSECKHMMKEGCNNYQLQLLVSSYSSKYTCRCSIQRKAQ